MLVDGVDQVGRVAVGEDVPGRRDDRRRGRRCRLVQDGGVGTAVVVDDRCSTARIGLGSVSSGEGIFAFQRDGERFL